MTSNVQELERAAAAKQIARDNLATVIQDARNAGMSLRAIAAIVGLSAETVRKIAPDQNHN